jgi:putative transposase
MWLWPCRDYWQRLALAVVPNSRHVPSGRRYVPLAERYVALVLSRLLVTSGTSGCAELKTRTFRQKVRTAVVYRFAIGYLSSSNWETPHLQCLGTFMRNPRTVAFWIERLPHWEVEDGKYFITMHLAGAIPETGKKQILEVSQRLTKVAKTDSPDWIKLHRKIFAAMESWMDRAVNNTWLSRSDIAELVVEAIANRQRRGHWNMISYVVMPNHVHLFCELQGMKKVIEDFKRWVGHQAAKLLDCEVERFWQREWFDHWSRSDEQDERIVRYISQNPVKANLVQDYRSWRYGSWAKD